VADRLERTPVRRTARGRVDVRVAIGVWFASWVTAQLLFALVAAANGGSSDADSLSIPALASAIVASWCAYLAGLWWASDRSGSGDFRADYALRFRVLDVVGVPAGVLTQLVVVPLVYLPLRAAWPDTFTDRRLEETARDLVDRASGASLVVLFLVVAVGAPVVEELVYRGMLQGAFVARVSEPLGLLAASAWFALIHFRPVEYPGLFVAGLVFGACFLATGRLGTAIVAHAAFNTTGLLAVWWT
jgi:membrane protease YdiL (CAAX protease family)